MSIPVSIKEIRPVEPCSFCTGSKDWPLIAAIVGFPAAMALAFRQNYIMSDCVAGGDPRRQNRMNYVRRNPRAGA